MDTKRLAVLVLVLGLVSTELHAGRWTARIGQALRSTLKVGEVTTDKGRKTKRAVWSATMFLTGYGLMAVMNHLGIVRSEWDNALSERDFLVGNEEIEPRGIESRELSRFDREELGAFDYDGYVVHYEWEGEHVTAPAAYLDLLGKGLLAMKTDNHPAHIIALSQVQGVQVDDNPQLGKFISVPVAAVELHSTYVAREAVAAQELLTQQHDHVLHGKVAKAFTSGYYLMRASFSVDVHGEVLPLDDPLYFMVYKDNATFVDVVVPTAQKCEQCHDASFPNEE